MANFLSFWSTVFPFESNDVRFENIFCYRKMFSQQKLTSYLKYFTAFRWDKFKEKHASNSHVVGFCFILMLCFLNVKKNCKVQILNIVKFEFSLLLRDVILVKKNKLILLKFKIIAINTHCSSI